MNKQINKQIKIIEVAHSVLACDLRYSYISVPPGFNNQMLQSPAYLKIKITYLNGIHKLFSFDKENKRHDTHGTPRLMVKIAKGHVLLGSFLETTLNSHWRSQQVNEEISLAQHVFNPDWHYLRHRFNKCWFINTQPADWPELKLEKCHLLQGLNACKIIAWKSERQQSEENQKIRSIQCQNTAMVYSLQRI